VHSAVGYAEESGIRLAPGVFRNPNATRSFMQPTQEARVRAVRRKLWPNPEEINGQRLVLIDDTVVRGTTTKEIISMLYDVGAQEVHLRVPSAPLRNPCFQGIDIGDPTTLLARRQGSIEAMRDVLGVDSLAFLSVEGMRAAIGSVREVLSESQQFVALPKRRAAALLNLSVGRLCSACMDGNYPIKVPEDTIVLPELK
jgi:amidophosphoribosyltransferase